MTMPVWFCPCLAVVLYQLASSSQAFSLGSASAAENDDDKQALYSSSMADNDFAWHEGNPPSATLEKRAPSVSINQDLVSLAKLLRTEAGRRRFQAASSYLSGIGKRSEVYQSLYGIPSPLVPAGVNSNDKRSSDTFSRPTRRISVNVPLDALSQMVRTARRREYDAKKLASVQNKFIDLGKRSS